MTLNFHTFFRQNVGALVLTFLSLSIFIFSLYPDVLPDVSSNTVYVEYAEGYPSGTCCGNTMVYNMTDDSLLLSIPIYRPPTVWNQTLPPLFAYFYVGTPFPILRATCAGGDLNCRDTFISSPFKLGNYWWVASNQTWQGCECLTMKISVSGAVSADPWGEKSLKFSLGNSLTFNLFQNATYILHNVFHAKNDTLIFGTGRDAYRNPFAAFSMFITQFYFGVIPIGEVKSISPLPLTVLGNGEVVWTVTGQTSDPYYGQDKLFALSTKNSLRDVATAFSGIAFGSGLGLVLEFHKIRKSKHRTITKSSDFI